MAYRGLLVVASVLSVLFLASLMYGGHDPVAPAQPVRAATSPLERSHSHAAPFPITVHSASGTLHQVELGLWDAVNGALRVA